MCTAAAYRTRELYFGRTLDYEHSFGEEVVVTPRNYPFSFRHAGDCASHSAIIGMACVMDGYPLYFDAANEHGLCIAGLNFVGNAHYFDPMPGKINVAQFELIPFLLTRCANLSEARALLEQINITAEPFRADVPCSQLHWMISDKTGSITLESMADGLHIYENPLNVLTNNPPFPRQLANFENYRHLSPRDPDVQHEPGAYSRGLGALGLPGDNSSPSRFVRVAFVNRNSHSADDEISSVSQFFHILGSVDVQRGCVRLSDGSDDITIYTSCISADRGIYYYTCCGNHQISAVDMRRENLDAAELIRHPLIISEQIYFQN